MWKELFWGDFLCLGLAGSYFLLALGVLVWPTPEKK